MLPTRIGLIVLFCGLVAACVIYGNINIFHKDQQVQSNKWRPDTKDITHLTHRETIEATAKWLKARKNALKNSCRQLGLNKTMQDDEKSMTKLLGSGRVLVSEKYKLIVFAIPKCASTSIKGFLLEAEGITTQEELKEYTTLLVHPLAEAKLKLYPSENFQEIIKKMNSYRKLVIVRDPLYRLLSAYRNKLEYERTWAGRFNLLSKTIHSMFNEGSKNESATFSEFLSYITKSNKMNSHWNFYHEMCLPCTITYDFIVHLETIDDDMSYVIKTLGMKNIAYPNSGSKTTDQKIKTYFSEVNPDLLHKIYQKYKLDYDLFGYKFPKI